MTSKESLPLFCTLAAAVLIAELVMVALLHIPRAFSMAILLHVCICLVQSISVYYTASQGWERRMATLLLVMSALTGPYGAAICLLAALGAAWCGQSDVSSAEWIDRFLVAEEPITENDRMFERATQGLDDVSVQGAVEPFQDVLTGGTVLQKQMAIAKITRYFRPAFAPLLLQAAQDSNAAVRVQAATALARIERDFMAQYMRLEKSLRTVPDPQARLKLAKLCDDYAHAGLLDDNSRQELRKKAIGIYEEWLATHKDAELQVRLARLYLRQGQPEKTSELLGKDIDAEKNTQPAAIFWYMEALFRLRNLGKLRQITTRYAKTLAQWEDYRLAETDSVLRAWHRG
jgi:polysaccharide biosynthesis protein PelE